jgi:hypothetical protein
VNLFGYSHGKEGKRIEHLMQDEVPELWGDSIFREWRLGDHHSERVWSVGELLLRRITSITAIDKWHRGKGYRAIRRAQAFISDIQLGPEHILQSNIVTHINNA